MPKELIIEDKTYFFDCAVKGDVIEYLLYDSGNNWIATKTSEEVAHTLQLLNKRIKYDVQIAYDTLQNTQPETAGWVKSNDHVDGIAALERVLKLKYRVKGCPFNFEWCLKRYEDKGLTIQLPVKHVTSLVDILPSKIEELLDVLQCKEREINQYRLEKGSLRRSTLATSDFDVEQFREEYASAENSVKSLQKFLVHWRVEHGVISTVQEEENARPSSSCTKKAVKKEEEEAGTSSPSRSKLIKESPRNKKRKALQTYKTQMARTLHTSKKQLEYESQSQSLSESEIPAAGELEETNQNATNNKRKAENSLHSNDDESTENAVKRRRTITKTTASNTPKPLTNSIDEGSSKSTKEVPSNSKKLSPISAQRPNTRQRRRDYESQGSVLIDDTARFETPRKSVVDTPNGSTELVKNINNKSAIKTPKMHNIQKHNNITGIQNTTKSNFFNNLEQSKNDLSAYVDSMLSQLEAIDKELQA